MSPPSSIQRGSGQDRAWSISFDEDWRLAWGGLQERPGELDLELGFGPNQVVGVADDTDMGGPPEGWGAGGGRGAKYDFNPDRDMRVAVTAHGTGMEALS